MRTIHTYTSRVYAVHDGNGGAPKKAPHFNRMEALPSVSGQFYNAKDAKGSLTQQAKNQHPTAHKLHVGKPERID
jgi:hypothetical protein